jgi:hypothetical protein
MLFGPSPFVTSSGDSLGYHGAWARRARSDSPAAPSGWPSTVDALVEWIEAHGNTELPGHDVTLARHARAAATLARRDGACDALIAAAVVHDLPFIEEQPTREAWLPMPWLRTLFDDNVLGPVRLMGEARAHRALGDAASRSDFLSQPHAARAMRLVGFDTAARSREAAQSALPWSSLLPILHRVARD